ncbi:MAG: DUF488 domain-containing protein [Methanoregula sp.]
MNQDIVPKKCFTIGYGDYPIELFLYFLQKTGIDTIIDVRSSPYSKYNLYFNRDNLEKSLIKNKIDYRYMGDKIGGRYSNPNLLFPDGTVNYLKVQNTEQFQDGINQVLSIISTGKKIALMCAEKEPERCHRFALISRVLQSKGIKVIHVRPEIKLQENEDLEKELINSVIDNKQATISSEQVNPVDTMYEKLNKKIAYKTKDYMAPVEENAITEKGVMPVPSVEKIENGVQDPPVVSEPTYISNPVIDMSPMSDSFSGKRTKKLIQKSLF